MAKTEFHTRNLAIHVMKKIILLFYICSCLLSLAAVKAQFETYKDSVVQLYGVVMSADSLKGIARSECYGKGPKPGNDYPMNRAFFQL